MQGEGIDLVAGARIDFAHDRIVAGDEPVGVTGQPPGAIARAKAASRIDARVNARLVGATVQTLLGDDSRSAV